MIVIWHLLICHWSPPYLPTDTPVHSHSITLDNLAPYIRLLQITEREDPILCSDVRNNLFGPMEFSRRDLAALNIMRGRDNGLPDYNTVRKCFGFPMMNHFSEINPEQYAQNPDIFHQLEEEYEGDLMNIDLYVGGMLESYGGPGPLFTKIIKEQFERLRDSDRFWFENNENDLFSKEEIKALKNLKLSDIIIAVTNINRGDIQENVFFHHEGDPCPQPEQLNATKMEPCMFLKGYDYFQGSEVPYIFGVIVILFIPVALLCSAYGVVKIMNSRRRKIKTKWEADNGKGIDKMYVKEWLHHSAKRNAKITFGPDEAFHLRNRKGEKLRSVSVKGIENLVCQVTQDRDKKPMLLISVEKDHDLVLEFSNGVERKKLLTKLETFLQSYKKRLETVPTYKDEMLAVSFESFFIPTLEDGKVQSFKIFFTRRALRQRSGGRHGWSISSARLMPSLLASSLARSEKLWRWTAT